MTATTTNHRPLEQDKDKLIALIKSGSNYAQAYRQLRPDCTLKNPSGAVAEILGKRADFDEKYKPETRLESSIPSPFKNQEITESLMDEVAGLLVLGKKDFEIVQELKISLDDFIKITDLLEIKEVKEKAGFNKKINYRHNYQRIGELLNRGESYGFIMRDVFNKENNTGNALYTHIKKYFNSKDEFLAYWQTLQEDKQEQLNLTIQKEQKLKEQFEKKTEKLQARLKEVEKELIIQKVIVKFCEQKMSVERLKEIKDISSLMVKSMKFDGAESLTAIVNIITGIEQYITKP